ncbi:HutD family protein [Pectinatus brassicae]|uniref:Environmental stress-induced protein Ves n=1 Tax=Pectinatus brassicae TaxID=862415 RepID=A0A840ULK6_9FIRM|nr:HutD family protein [Pectinatus brassicae]MBB5336657.1 environmental stress-induced protein Ves [Pectinatus brassicae]
MAVNIISATDTATTDWSGGQTTQLYISPQDADYKKRTFKLRLSSATVTADKSAFTKLKNIDRILMTLQSN